MRPTHGQVRDKAVELETFLWDRLAKTFPHGDAYRLMKRFGDEGHHFMGQLELFHDAIAGYCSSGKRWLQANEKRMAECRAAVERPFFARYPQFQSFESRLREYPNIVEWMELFEVARARLKALMATLEQVKNR